MSGQLLDGRYRIIQFLGAGGFGKTYIAEDTKLYDARCVVKQLQPTSTDPTTLQVARRLFKSEAKILYQLGNHEQIPRLLAYFEENQEFYLVQELIAGHDLSEELTPGKKLSESYVIVLLQNLLETLAFVHQHHVIHRDIKPQNLIRRQQDGKIVLIDFGAVKQISTQVVNAQGQTRMTVSIGTPGYMPSEQASGSPRLSSDIYAVGMIGIQALTGLLPEYLPQDPQTAEIIWRNRVQVSSKLANILDKMVRYDFRQRYPSATEASQALQKLFNTSGGVSQSAQVASTQRVSPPRNPIKTPSPTPPVPPQYHRTSRAQPQSFPPPVTPAPVKRPEVGSWFWLKWATATFVGLMVAGFGFNVVAALIPVALVVSQVMSSILGISGILVGIMQWLVLRRHIYQAGWWVLATAVGYLTGGWFVFTQDAVFYSGFVLGTVLGILQWLVLRKQVYEAGRWFFVNVVTFGVCHILTILIIAADNSDSGASEIWLSSS
ncbi:MAG: protein kinase [Symploca sp. SIO1C2]|nr:protein kinase [Symploca sp. SIO1C2]